MTTEQEIEKISVATAKLYTRLTDSLSERTPSTNGFTAILDLEYERYIDVKGVEQLNSEVNTSELHPFNTKGETVNCICGQRHIQRCSIMRYTNPNVSGLMWDKILLGSECIETTLEFLRDIQGVDSIYEKLQEWSSTMKIEKRRLTHNKCVSCDRYDIVKGKEYKNPALKTWCRKCVSGGRVKCIQCPRMRVYQKDWKGNPMLLCFPCYKKNQQQ